MERRRFLANSMLMTAAGLATGGGAFAAPGESVSPGSPGSPGNLGNPGEKVREFYLLRRYSLQAGPQTSLAESYFSQALLPALTRMGMGPTGAFRLEIGPETPSYYVLIPGASAEALATLDVHLGGDASFLAAAAPFWSAPATAPAFLRVESTLLWAFEGWPRLTPPATLTVPARLTVKDKRIFQLRTYESPTHQDHVRKVEMFHSGEFDIFAKAGFRMVFFGDTLVGTRMPSLTYMLSFADMAELGAQWQSFVNDPAWKKLSTSPRYSSEELVSSITNLVLSPLACSHI